MNANAALYDYAPLVRLLLLGGLLALLPLAWVWLRQRNASTAQRLAHLTGLTLFLTFDLVLFGAFTRLTDSGLGCPDWPGCYGHASPLGASEAIAVAQTAMPTGPVTWSKAWVEMVHRYLATAVGGLILVLAVVSWLERKRLKISLRWPLLTLVWVCVQGAFGAWTVTFKLFPAIVTLHLLGAMTLLALLRVQAVRYRHAMRASWATGGHWSAGTRWAVGLVFALVLAQIALGGWVSTNYAVLACNEFPTCQQSWWPDMDFRAGFELWRELGHNSAGEILHFAALTAIHYAHRLMAYAVLLALLALAWRLWRVDRRRTEARVLLALAAWQLASGLSNVVLNWPLPAALAHTAGAAALIIVFTGWLADMHPAPPSASVLFE
ncbi:MAG TPA: COX15/CtaA family protein [Macromonas sp.]|nr:COX15/CtaA family protein [Macromonas sp.]